MAVAITRPPGGRSDDVRALRFRFRTLTLSGNYATGGETVLAKDLGLKRIQFIVPQETIVGALGLVGTLPSFVIAADGSSVVIKQSEDAAGAAGTVVGQEKTNAEAYVANSILNILAIGY